MKFRRVGLGGYKKMGMQPVYVKSVGGGKKALKIVGLREDYVQLEGVDSLMSTLRGAKWFKDGNVFVVTGVCDQQLKPGGCQVHNVNCCGGGRVITNHVSYWKDLVD